MVGMSLIELKVHRVGLTTVNWSILSITYQKMVKKYCFPKPVMMASISLFCTQHNNIQMYEPGIRGPQRSLSHLILSRTFSSSFPLDPWIKAQKCPLKWHLFIISDRNRDHHIMRLDSIFMICCCCFCFRSQLSGTRTVLLAAAGDSRSSSHGIQLQTASDH